MPSKRTVKLGGSKYSQLVKKTSSKVGRKLSERQKTQVKRLVSVGREEKYYISSYVGGVSYDPYIIDVCQVASGTTDITRNGDEIKFKRLEWVVNFSTTSLDSATTTYNNMRVVIFQWRPLTTPVASSIVDTNPPAVIGTVNAPFFQYNWDDRTQYKILYSRNVFLDNTNGPKQRRISGVLFGKKITKKIRYNSTALTPGFNHIYVALVSDDGATPYPQVYFRCRLVYTDA